MRGRFQDPPFLSTTPFHRFGVNIRTREEDALLAACHTMNAAEHRWVGPAMHDRIVGALETCCRQGKMLRIQNRHVDWTQHQIAIPGGHAKDAENRRVPLIHTAAWRRSRGAARPWDPTRSCSARPSASSRTSCKTAWESLILLANGHDTTRAKPGARVDRAGDRSPLARRAT